MKHLYLPLLATIANLLLALIFNGRSSRSRAEPIPAQREHQQGGGLQKDDGWDLIPAQQEEEEPAQHRQQQQEEERGWNLIPAQQEGWDEPVAALGSSSACSLSDGGQEYCLDGTTMTTAGDAPNDANACGTISEGLTTSTKSGGSVVGDSQVERNLLPMPEPFGDFRAYVRPDVATFYQEEGDGGGGGSTGRQLMTPKHKGMAGKFINLTPDRMQMYWVGNDGGSVFMGVADAFASYGTGTYAGHKFYFSPTDDNANDSKVCEFTVKKGTSVYFCDPYSRDDEEEKEGRATTNESRDVNSLSDRERERYDALVLNLEFGLAYKSFTGSEWLSQYPRNPPRNNMWQADYFGQQHSVQTQETQFQEIPITQDARSTGRGTGATANNETELAIPFQNYRGEESLLNLTLTVVSCAPRIFEIDNFLSEAEVDHLLSLATEKDLPRSTTGMGASTKSVDTTRTSRNTWLDRTSSPVVDAIYRRAADALGIDEALMRRRQPHEYPDLGTRQSIAEPLQLVHYDIGQEYTAHHDFGYPTRTGVDHPSRWANILLYLNDVDAGGETSFPRWVNGDTSDALDVKPKKGKAALFYMLNGDGNLDDLSQHAALPVTRGEKWLANLWLWDPVRK